MWIWICISVCGYGVRHGDKGRGALREASVCMHVFIDVKAAFIEAAKEVYSFFIVLLSCSMATSDAAVIACIHTQRDNFFCRALIEGCKTCMCTYMYRLIYISNICIYLCQYVGWETKKVCGAGV